jgi:outer membrane lipoprotein-sorting protein
MRRMRTAVGLGLLVCLLLGSGCPAPPCPTTPHTEPLQALENLRAMRRPVRTLRAKARVEQRGAEGRIRGTVMLFVQRPDRVRFDAMTQFGPAAILTSDGQQFALSDLREKRYLTGPTCPSNIARLLGIRMSGEQVARLLVGDAPHLDAKEKRIECTEDGTYLVVLTAPDGRTQEIELAVRKEDRKAPPSEQHLRLRRAAMFDPGGDRIWHVRLSEYQIVEDPSSEQTPGRGVAMPFEVFFVHERDDAEVRVQFESIDLNVDVPEGAFEQSPRSGMTVERASCQ